MSRLRKYFKPYLGWFFLAILLLFGQANSELTLPDYMSDIISVGIQQQGIESPIPEIIRQTTLERLLKLAASEERQLILDACQSVDSSQPHYSALLKQYPYLKDTPAFTVKNLAPEEKQILEPIFTRLWLTQMGLDQANAHPQQIQQILQQMGLDPAQLPAEGTLESYLQRLPQDQQETVLERFRSYAEEQIRKMQPGMEKQTAIRAVQQEYKALGADNLSIQNRYILKTGGVMMLITLAVVACATGVGFLSSYISAGLARDLRSAIYKKVMSFSIAEFEAFSTASLITRTTNDISQIQGVVMMLVRMIFLAPMMGIGGILRAMNKGASMWWLIALSVGILMLFILIIFIIAIPRFKLIQKLVDRLNLISRENLSGMLVIRAFNQQDFEKQRFDQANQEVTNVTRFVSRIMFSLFPTLTLIMNVLTIMIIWIGSHQVAAGSMMVGDMMAFMQYAMQIIFSFMIISFVFFMVPRASVSAERVADVLESEITICDPKQPAALPAKVTGVLSFDHVSFRYPDAAENILSDIHFTARPGQITAILGSTGSGKSTLLNLIPRFYDVNEGKITLDDTDIRTIPQQTLREHIGLIPQKTSLFSGTIASNLQAGSPTAGEAEMIQAIQTAQAREMIESSPEGLQAPVSQGGSNISGGQKQRLSIARALIKNAPVILFDDSFSALDFKTEAALRKELKTTLRDKTIIIVTQRVASVIHADQIIILDEGVIVGRGVHKDLMQTCQTYREIALSQLDMEELA